MIPVLPGMKLQSMLQGFVLFLLGVASLLADAERQPSPGKLAVPS
jgi:hypothetical protein